jgi:hypothetical protein
MHEGRHNMEGGRYQSIRTFLPTSSTRTFIQDPDPARTAAAASWGTDHLFPNGRHKLDAEIHPAWVIAWFPYVYEAVGLGQQSGNYRLTNKQFYSQNDLLSGGCSCCVGGRLSLERTISVSSAADHHQGLRRTDIN